MPEVRLPSFLIVGAAKSGTTSLADYLGQHPDVFMPRSKEPNYFAFADRKPSLVGPASAEVLQKALYNWSRLEWDDYVRLFATARPGQAVGEGSVRYLYFENAPENIHRVVPDARLVVMLRHPVDRLYSHFVMNKQVMLEPLDIAAAVAAEDDRVSRGWGWDWHYIRCGLYTRQLQRYFDRFSREQIAVFLYDDFRKDPAGIYAAICRHIGVRDDFRPDMSRRGMVGSFPRNEALARWLWWPSKSRYRLLRYARPAAVPLIRRLKEWNALPPPALDASLREELGGRFREDLAALSDLLGRRLPWSASGPT